MIQINENDEHLDGVDGDADVLDWQGAGLGATTETKGWFSQELEQMRKESRFSLCKDG